MVVCSNWGRVVARKAFSAAIDINELQVAVCVDAAIDGQEEHAPWSMLNRMMCKTWDASGLEGAPKGNRDRWFGWKLLHKEGSGNCGPTPLFLIGRSDDDLDKTITDIPFLMNSGKES
jgi:hypothetical protein